jgi:hypothetical protein
VIDFDTVPDQTGPNPVHATRASIALMDRLRHRNQRRACRHRLVDRGKRALSSGWDFICS